MSELKHYGILGMKWGERKARRLIKKKSKTMSDDELKKETERLSLEKKYTELTKPKTYSGEKGKKFVSEVLSNIGKDTYENINKQVVDKYGDESVFVNELIKNLTSE